MTFIQLSIFRPEENNFMHALTSLSPRNSLIYMQHQSNRTMVIVVSICKYSHDEKKKMANCIANLGGMHKLTIQMQLQFTAFTTLSNREVNLITIICKCIPSSLANFNIPIRPIPIFNKGF